MKVRAKKMIGEFKNGDKVKYKECFGDEVLVFIGYAESLNFANDSVCVADGGCFPVRASGLTRAE